jgi:hypothetical protein
MATTLLGPLAPAARYRLAPGAVACAGGIGTAASRLSSGEGTLVLAFGDYGL